MEFFCVRTKPRHAKGRYNKWESSKEEETRKKKQTSIARIVQVEARLREDIAKNKKPGKQSHRRSKAREMSTQSYTNSPRVDVGAPDEEPQCPCVCCRARARAQQQQHARTPTHNTSRPLGGDDTLPSLDGQAQQNLQHSAVPSSQIYVHPYSTEHHRFPVVDHSITCHGRHPGPHPTCYMAIVPDGANFGDIEAALASRPGLTVMARILENGELAPIRTFVTIRNLRMASLQLEIWDSGNL
ncbi:hypothetical protein O1611_g9886 [Lasiodiplodia mahajangana]|uniref:Uncharacterized protein n=1 Tax=Lasiodiplodia mahajangana TaxID=1108764 RepID=A0ACC2J4J9_9PEZI|nr:hypothetical protein O1611_g9886 [Lasiodiplodia mahajangana]